MDFIKELRTARGVSGYRLARDAGITEIKIFEIGTVFKKSGEEVHVAYGNKKEVKEMTLEEFTKEIESQASDASRRRAPALQDTDVIPTSVKFKMWSLFPFKRRILIMGYLFLTLVGVGQGCTGKRGFKRKSEVDFRV